MKRKRAGTCSIVVEFTSPGEKKSQRKGCCIGRKGKICDIQGIRDDNVGISKTYIHTTDITRMQIIPKVLLSQYPWQLSIDDSYLYGAE